MLIKKNIHKSCKFRVSDCGNPSPANGQANTPDGTTYGSAATITCDSGYVLNGSSYLTCRNGSNWSDTPTCVRGEFKCISKILLSLQVFRYPSFPVHFKL